MKWSDFADSGASLIQLQSHFCTWKFLQDENVTCGGLKDVDFHYFAKVATNPIELDNFEGSSPLHWFSSEPVKIGQWAKIDGISTWAPGLKNFRNCDLSFPRWQNIFNKSGSFKCQGGSSPYISATLSRLHGWSLLGGPRPKLIKLGKNPFQNWSNLANLAK